MPVPKSGSVEEQIYVASMLFFLAYTDTERGVIPLSLIFFYLGSSDVARNVTKVTVAKCGAWRRGAHTWPERKGGSDGAGNV